MGERLEGRAGRQYERRVSVTASRAELKGAWVPALLVLAAMVPATIVIPVVRGFVAANYPGQEWLIHAFMTFNLLGACLVGPSLAVRADRQAQRRYFAAGLALVDGLTLLGVGLGPPAWVMLALRFVQGAASVAAVSILMGAARGRAKSSGEMGLIGGSVVLAIVVGIPLGAVLAKSSPEWPLFVGAAIGVVAGLVTLLSLPASTDAERSPISLRSLLIQHTGLRLPTVVVGLERMAVGAFVVTMQLHGHHVLKVPDAKVSGWFSAFLVTFALASWPMARLAERVDRSKLIALGAATYGAMFIGLGVLPATEITLVLLVGGLGSAAIYGPALTLASRSVPEQARSSAMAVLNAAGTLGMFLGNVAAFALSSGLVEAGFSREVAYPVVFIAAGLTQLLSVATALTTQGRAAAPVAPSTP